MAHQFTCNKFKCDETYTKYEVSDTRYCPNHQPSDPIGAGAVIF